MRIRSLTLLGALLFAAAPSWAQEPGTCVPGQAEAYLDGNNVRARIPNTGNLFWRGNPNVYEVPIGGGVYSLFTLGFWVAGKVEGELRAAGSRYGPYEFFPGPLDPNGALPDASDCSAYDRIYKVDRSDLLSIERSGDAPADVRDWPWQLGAPVVDGDGVPGNYNLADGDRPEILGTQSLWWVMNDLGGSHESTDVNPLGLEVQVMASAAYSADPAIDHATLYRYVIVNKQASALEDAYIGIYVDPDLGDFQDDYVGSDTTFGMGFVYNGDNDDERDRQGYGIAPPALGIDIIRGPRGLEDGLDNDRDGVVDEADEHLGMTAFVNHSRNGGGVQGPFGDGTEMYQYMQAQWRDGQPITFGGDGRSFSLAPTMYMFPGDPVTRSFWSEINYDNQGNSIPPRDRHFIMASGPFRLEPGEADEIVFSIVWVRGLDHLDSIFELRKASTRVEQAYHDGFSISFDLPQEAPHLLVPADGVTDQPVMPRLQWDTTPDTQYYLLEVALDEDFSEAVYAERLVRNTTSHEVHGLEPATTHFWRIRPLNPAGFGPWSQVYRFTTQGETITLDSPGLIDFQVVANAAGVLDPPVGAGADFGDFPGLGRPDDRQQQRPGLWLIHTGGDYRTYTQFTERTFGQGATLHDFDFDYEWRFSGQSTCLRDDQALVTVPFELWRTGIATPDDPSDDVRMTCRLQEDAPGGAPMVFDLGGDSPLSGADNDPYSDAVAWYLPADSSAGEAGYLADEQAMQAGTYLGGDTGREVWRRMALVAWNGGEAPPYEAPLPEAGTVFRLVGRGAGARYTTPPLPAAPASGTEGVAPSLELWWNEEATARAYHVQVARDAAFTSLVAEADTLVEGWFEASGLETGETYYWRVRMTPLLDWWSAWSEVWTFTVGQGTAMEGGEDLPAHYALAANYPNPFAGRTAIGFALPEAGRVRLTVYDVLGREVAHLVEAVLPAGRHEVAWESSGHASGVYYYRLEAGAFRQTRAMLLVR